MFKEPKHSSLGGSDSGSGFSLGPYYVSARLLVVGEGFQNPRDQGGSDNLEANRPTALGLRNIFDTD